MTGETQCTVLLGQRKLVYNVTETEQNRVTGTVHLDLERRDELRCGSVIRKAQFLPRVSKFFKIKRRTKENARITRKNLRNRGSRFLVGYFLINFLHRLPRRRDEQN